jgi:hypothetical protein
MLPVPSKVLEPVDGRFEVAFVLGTGAEEDGACVGGIGDAPSVVSPLAPGCSPPEFASAT